ncbi:MAG: hypothetical protein Q4B40_02610 [Clostridia bacterium]|nr:hypothetical protein [Clostridia bacterium]
MKSQNPNKKNFDIVTITVVLVLIGVLIYAIFDGTDLLKPKAPKLKNQIELNADNIANHWEKRIGEKIYSLDFGPGSDFIYGCHIDGELTLEFCSTSGDFVISGDTVIVKYTLNETEYIEKYYAAVSATELVIAETEDGFETILGTYTCNSDETQSTKDTSSETKTESDNKKESNPTVSWNALYKAYIELNYNGVARSAPVFDLGYIDNDTVPELFIFDQYDGSQKVCTVKDGNIKEQILPYNFAVTSYIEKSGSFMQKLSSYDSEAAGMDIFATVYSLANGSFNVAHFYECDSGITSTTYDTDRDYGTFNADELINSWIDPQKAVEFKELSYDEIISKLS